MNLGVLTHTTGVSMVVGRGRTCWPRVELRAGRESSCTGAAACILGMGARSCHYPDNIVSSQKQFTPVMMADVAPLTTLSQLHILGQRFQWLVRASVCYRRIVRGYRALIRL